MKNICDDEFLMWLRDFIDARIELKNKKLPYDKTYNGKVVSVGSGVATIKFPGDDITQLTLRNDTGKTLNINDEVIVTALNNNLNNATITIKK